MNSILNETFQDLINRYPQLAPVEESFKLACEVSINAIKKNKKIMTCGNGGSASDAEHIVGELLKGFLSQRYVKNDDRLINLPSEFKSNLQGTIRAISLMGHPSYQSAFSNDKDPIYAIAQHLYGLADEGDILIAISTSGNSRNILKAAELARHLKVKVIGLTGESGGKLSEIADICIKAPSNKVHYIQELHLPIYHSYCIALENCLF